MGGRGVGRDRERERERKRDILAMFIYSTIIATNMYMYVQQEVEFLYVQNQIMLVITLDYRRFLLRVQHPPTV